MKKHYVIAGCNGAGKTTASFNILPDILGCREFVNADEIARGLSPFQSETVAFEAGRIMLKRINELLSSGADFAIETALSSLTYRQFIKEAQSRGYFVTLLFYWLETPELAQERVRKRVAAGGHSIPVNIIQRRYRKGISNLFSYYILLCDNCIIFDNSNTNPVIIFETRKGSIETIHDKERFKSIMSYYHEQQ